MDLTTRHVPFLIYDGQDRLWRHAALVASEHYVKRDGQDPVIVSSQAVDAAQLGVTVSKGDIVWLEPDGTQFRGPRALARYARYRPGVARAVTRAASAPGVKKVADRAVRTVTKKAGGR